jgi:cell pole-organizing protein PopZ
MEEILASIRRIIAEDTSGSRTVPPPPAPSRAQPSPVRPNADVRPVASPQRGFMSREAFMKSSAPADDDPGEQRFFTPVTPQDPLPAADAASAPVSEGSTAKASPSSHVPEDVKVKVEAKPAEMATIKAEKSSASEKSDVPLDKTEPDKSTAAEVKAIVEAEQKSLTPEAKSEAQIIDAQLVELLGEDLKALRESDEREDRKSTQTQDIAAKAVPSPETVSPKSPEPAAKINGASSSIIAPVAARDETPDVRDNADPFAFDLGPSPFLPRSMSEKSPERKNSIEPTPAPQRLLGSQREEPGLSAAQGWAKTNGAPVFPETARPAASPPRNPEPATPSTPQRPATFAVPSVSATLGPQRRLEPLSEAFKPAASEYRKPVEPPSDPFPFREFARSAATSVEPGRVAHEGRLQPAPPPLSALPPLDAHADPVIGGDRTMEDAVADLLRPLLKTWLAENMPKIVERALRREMTERLLPGHKNARD